MENIDFEDYRQGPMADYSIRNAIHSIYSLLNAKESINLRLALSEFPQHLMVYFSEQKHIYPVESVVKIFFSQFLQYLFHYTLRTLLDEQYVNERLLTILAEYPEEFYYYQVSKNGERKVVLWVDPSTKETALMAACRKARVSVVQGLLKSLVAAFQLKEAILDDVPHVLEEAIPHALEVYFFQKNHLHQSALTLSWWKNRKAISDCLIEFAKKYYGNLESGAFQRFLFQVDSSGVSALAKAIMLKNTKLAMLILEKSREIYKEKSVTAIQNLFLLQDSTGATVLHRAVEMKDVHLLKILLSHAADTLQVKSAEFKQFLLTPDFTETNSFILACKTNFRIAVYVLTDYAEKNDLARFETVKALILQQDKENYTGLLHAVEKGYVDIVRLIVATSIGSIFDFFPTTSSINDLCGLELKTRDGRSVLQVAIQGYHWEILDILCDTLDRMPKNQQVELISSIHYPEDSSNNVLSLLYAEVSGFFSRLSEEGRFATPEEIYKSKERLKLAKKLVKLGLQSSVETHLQGWEVINRPQAIAPLSFFSIFCPSLSRKRSINSSCRLSAIKFMGSLPETTSQLYKEAVVSSAALLSRTPQETIAQVARIRSSSFISTREREALHLFERQVANYFDLHGSAILKKLKRTTVPTLEEAFLRNPAAILIDNGIDLFFIRDKSIFWGAVLAQDALIVLHPEATVKNIQSWLDTYFSPQHEYTIHPLETFDSSLLSEYSAPSFTPVISDEEYLSYYYYGIEGKNFKKIFLIDGKSIGVAQLIESRFFEKYAGRLTFRSEIFHQYFFMLSRAEKKALKFIFSQYAVLIAQYPYLSTEENIYLRYYGEGIKKLLSDYPIDSISSLDLLEQAIITHEKYWTPKVLFSLQETEEIIKELRLLKTRLSALIPIEASFKVGLQLLLALLPSGIQASIHQDPVDLLVPLELMLGDVILRKLLTNLIHHPQVSLLFSESFTTGIFTLLEETTERIPFLGTTLALYGLVQSGKTLLGQDKNGPRAYYAHLLMNNLLTIGAISVGAAIDLPFYPLLGLFSLLAADQVMTEGIHIHDDVLHLQDDKTHPLLKFFTEVKLGLDIVDGNTQKILRERSLLEDFFAYFDEIPRSKDMAIIVTAILPSFKYTDINKRRLDKDSDVDCHNFPHNIGELPVYPQSSLCIERHSFLERGRYSVHIGEQKQFCERVDPFFPAEERNYLLLTGSRSKDCSSGVEVSKNMMAEADGGNAIGLLIDKRYKDFYPYNRAALFLPIDPNHVLSFSVQFTKKNEELIVPEDLDSSGAIHCSENIEDCIRHIVVLIATFYAKSSSEVDTDKKTEIKINDETFRGSVTQLNERYAGLQSIEYQVVKSDNVIIFPNKIPKQIVALSEPRTFYFSNNQLLSNHGFQIELTDVEIIELSLADPVRISGSLTTAKKQTLRINTLKGASEENPAIVNVEECKLFSIQAGSHVRLMDNWHEIVIKGNSSKPILIAYGHDKSQKPFNRLLLPINTCQVSISENNLILSCLDKHQEFTRIDVILKVSLIEETLSIFSGTYEIAGHTCFSRILLSRAESGEWKSELEINGSPLTNGQNLDLSLIKNQNFDKVSILTENPVFKLRHYLFNPSHVQGKFRSYQLKVAEEGWLLILKGENLDEETHCFLAETSKEILINNIRYALKPAFASLFASATLAHGPIATNDLITPLKLETEFSETKLFFQSDRYSIENIPILNLPATSIIHFADQALAFSYIKYRALIQQKRNAIPVDTDQLDSQPLVEEHRPKNLSSLAVQVSNGNSWSSYGIVGAIGAVLASACTAASLWISKRFKRSRSTPASVKIMASAIPLLENKGAMASSQQTSSQEATVRRYKVDSLNDNVLFTKKENLPFQFKVLNSQSKPLFFDEREINQQLIFAHYIIHYFFNKKSSASETYRESFSNSNRMKANKNPSKLSFFAANNTGLAKNAEIYCSYLNMRTYPIQTRAVSQSPDEQELCNRTVI